VEPNTPPYWITIVLAIAAWLFTTTVDQILKTPYHVNREIQDTNSAQTADIVTTTIALENITDDKAYPNVSLRFLVEDPGEFKTAVVRPYQPAWEGDDQPKPAGHTFEHTLPIIQPGGRFDLILTHTCGNCAMHLTLLRDKTDDNTKNTVIVLTEENYITFISEHHVLISATAIMILFLSLIGHYLFESFVTLTNHAFRSMRLSKEVPK
jgi:hypothetical protein